MPSKAPYTQLPAAEGGAHQYTFLHVGLNSRVGFGSRQRVGLLGGFVVKMDMVNRRLMPSDTRVKLE